MIAIPRYVIVVIVILILVGIMLVAPAPRKSVIVALQDAALVLHPSAADAYADGDKYFNDKNSHTYDLDVAEHFYKEALRLDPRYPYVNHQLARIEFLHSHFATALWYIDRQISIFGQSEPNSFYVRGLIEGYMQKYDASTLDYAVYIAHDPNNWAATNDFAWVLLKANRPAEALTAIEKVLPQWTKNPWLLNSKATALFALGNLDDAYVAANAASVAAQALTPKEWSAAYPGNDPLIGAQGVAAIQQAILENIHNISVARTARERNMR